MAIDQKYTDLINADIDGEISDAEKATLSAFLAQSEEGRSVHSELTAFFGSLDTVDPELPPPHLRHVIMSSIRPVPEKPESPGYLQALCASSSLKFAATFAAGAVLALSVVDSNRISNSAFDDVARLVGTIADPVNGESRNSITVNKTEIAGKISLRQTGSMLILDFDLVAMDPIEIEAVYADRTIWFNGFASLQSSGTSISAESGRVTIGMEGKRRYAVFLHNEGDRRITVSLRFIVGGEVIHEASLDYDPAE